MGDTLTRTLDLFDEVGQWILAPGSKHPEWPFAVFLDVAALEDNIRKVRTIEDELDVSYSLAAGSFLLGCSIARAENPYRHMTSPAGREPVSVAMEKKNGLRACGMSADALWDYWLQPRLHLHAGHG